MPLAQHIDFQELADLLLDIVCAVGAEGTFLYVSAACEQVLGYTREELQGRLMLDFVHPDDRQRTLDVARQVIAGQPLLNFENRYLRKDGRVAHLQWSARWSERNFMRIAVARDVSESKRSDAVQKALYRISEAVHEASDLPALYAEIHRCIGDLLPARNFLVALLDPADGHLHFPYFVDEFDAAPASLPLSTPSLCGEVIRRGEALLLTPDDRDALPAHLQVYPGHRVVDWLGVPLRTADGVLGALAVQSYAGDLRYTAQDRDLLQFVSSQVAAAIERKRLYARQEYLALHDPLTGLPNRRLFEDRLHGALTRGRRNATRFALLFLDLDRFKQVNDRLGHDAGDRLLQQVGKRLLERVRSSDTVARIGGDEFVLLLESITSPAVVDLLCDKIREAFEPAFELGAVRMQISTSIGVALYPEDGLDERSLLAHADLAMYGDKPAAS